MIEALNKKYIVSIMNKMFFVKTEVTEAFQRDLEKCSRITLATMDENLKPHFGAHHNFDGIYDTVLKLRGRLNPDTGNPEIYEDDGLGTIIMPLVIGDYHGFAFYVYQPAVGIERTFIVISPYFEGQVPTEYIGTLLELKMPS